MSFQRKNEPEDIYTDLFLYSAAALFTITVNWK